MHGHPRHERRAATADCLDQLVSIEHSARSSVRTGAALAGAMVQTAEELVQHLKTLRNPASVLKKKGLSVLRCDLLLSAGFLCWSTAHPQQTAIPCRCACTHLHAVQLATRWNPGRH